MNYQYLSIAFLSTFLLSFSIVYFWQKILRKRNILDLPNDRSSHTIPTPRAGGIGIFFSYFLGLVGIWILYHSTQWDDIFLLSGSLLVFSVGLWDDFQSTKRRIRLFIHFTSSVFIVIWLWDPFLVYFGTKIDSPILLCLLAFIWVIGIVWSINLYNFMDGINGIAGMEAVFLSSAMAVFLAMENRGEQVFYKLILLAIATLGFVIWNFPRALVFLGDAGSGFLGFILAGFASYSVLSAGISVLSLLVIFSLFWIDTSLTILKRLKNKEKIFNAHNSHAYQILSRKWKSHANVTILYSLINVLILFPIAVCIQKFPSFAWNIFGFVILGETLIYIFISKMEGNYDT